MYLQVPDMCDNAPGDFLLRDHVIYRAGKRNRARFPRCIGVKHKAHIDSWHEVRDSGSLAVLGRGLVCWGSFGSLALRSCGLCGIWFAGSDAARELTRDWVTRLGCFSFRDAVSSRGRRGVELQAAGAAAGNKNQADAEKNPNYRSVDGELGENIARFGAKGALTTCPAESTG